MTSISDILNGIAREIKKIFWFLGLHAFSLIIFLIFIGFVLGGFIFYKYVFLAGLEKPNPTEIILKFDEKKYQDVLKAIQQEESKLENEASQPASSTKNISSDIGI